VKELPPWEVSEVVEIRGEREGENWGKGNWGNK